MYAGMTFTIRIRANKPGRFLTCRVPLGLGRNRVRFLIFPLFDFKNTFSKNFQIPSANKNEMSRFFISAKEKFKNRTLLRPSHTCPLCNKKKLSLLY